MCQGSFCSWLCWVFWELILYNIKDRGAWESLDISWSLCLHIEHSDTKSECTFDFANHHWLGSAPISPFLCLSLSCHDEINFVCQCSEVKWDPYKVSNFLVLWLLPSAFFASVGTHFLCLLLLFMLRHSEDDIIEKLRSKSLSLLSLQGPSKHKDSDGSERQIADYLANMMMVEPVLIVLVLPQQHLHLIIKYVLQVVQVYLFLHQTP